jgi:hypothetical protein
MYKKSADFCPGLQAPIADKLACKIQKEMTELMKETGFPATSIFFVFKIF